MALDDFSHVRDPRLRALVAHWLDARKGRSLPSRQNINPLAVRSALSVIWLCDYDARQGSLPIRLMGEDIRALYNCDVRGRDLLDFFPQAMRKQIPYWLGLVADEPCATHAIGQVLTPEGIGCPAERIHLPLAENGETPDAVIGATAYQLGKPYEYELWLDEYGPELIRQVLIGTRVPVHGGPTTVIGRDGALIEVVWGREGREGPVVDPASSAPPAGRLPGQLAIRP